MALGSLPAIIHSSGFGISSEIVTRSVDSLSGNNGDDVIYSDGPHNSEESQCIEDCQEIVDGGAGRDHLSLSENDKFPTIPNEDVDIQRLDYQTREFFDLINRHRDAYGFIVNHKLSGELTDINDGMIFTGLAVITSALRGDNDASLQLLETLRDRPWADHDGKLRLVRHPHSFDYVRIENGFVRERNQPVTKDGIVGVMSGLYYAYTSPRSSDDVRSVARERSQSISTTLSPISGRRSTIIPTTTLSRTVKSSRKCLRTKMVGL